MADQAIEELAASKGWVSHPLRQALQELEVEIDASDQVDTEAFTSAALKSAYEKYAAPKRERG